MLWQGCATVHALMSLPALDTHAHGCADTGATFKNAVRTRVTIKSFAIIRIMYRPYDVASGWRRHHCGVEATDWQRPARQILLPYHPTGGVFGGKKKARVGSLERHDAKSAEKRTAGCLPGKSRVPRSPAWAFPHSVTQY